MPDAANNFLEGKVDRILVPVDFTPKSFLAIEHAVVAARIYNASICLMHVLESTVFIAGNVPGALETISAHCEGALESHAQSIRAENVPCSVLLRQGDLDRQIDEVVVEQDIGILVLATKAGTAYGGFQFASTAERILRKSSIPVLTVTDCHPVRKWSGNGRFQILYATDLSPRSMHALVNARAVQQRLPVDLTIAHVVPKHAFQEQIEIASRQLQALAEGTSGKVAILQGAVGPSIFKAALSMGADLIAVGVRKHSILREVLLGHTLLEILAGAPCPVLTIRV